MLREATQYHKTAKELQGRGAIKRTIHHYRLAAKAYKEYLNCHEAEKARETDYYYAYATCLFYSQYFIEAAKVYNRIRDSNVDNRIQKDSAFMAIKAYERHILRLIRGNELTEPPLPSSKSQRVSKMAIPEIYKEYQAALDAYVNLFPKDEHAAVFAYKAAEVDYRFMHFFTARKRFETVHRVYCDQHVAIKAALAIMVTCKLEYPQDLDKLHESASHLYSHRCGGNAKKRGDIGRPIKRLLFSIKAKRAEKTFRRANELMRIRKEKHAKELFLRAARDYLTIAEQIPDWSYAGYALHNSAVAYGKSGHHHTAAKLYERVWENYNKSAVASRSLWLAATNYMLCFEPENAMRLFRIIVADVRFRKDGRRNAAVFNMALIMRHEEQYAEAAEYFLRFARNVEKSQERDACEGRYLGSLAYKQLNDFSSMEQAVLDFTKKCGSFHDYGFSVVDALYLLGRKAEELGMWKKAIRYYSRTISEFAKLKLDRDTAAVLRAKDATKRLRMLKKRDRMRRKEEIPPIWPFPTPWIGTNDKSLTPKGTTDGTSYPGPDLPDPL